MIALRAALRSAARTPTAAAAAARRGRPGAHRWLSAEAPVDDAPPPARAVIFESDQSFKFRALSVFGGVYTTCWLTYVIADVFVIDPDGSIAANSGLVSLIGVSSVSAGGYVVRSLAAKTVGRLEVDGGAAPPTLRITTYGAAGAERTRDAPLSDVVPRSDPGDTSRLRTFALPDDPTRPFLVLVEEDTVKDPSAFAKVTAGVAPFDAGGAARTRRARRRARRRRRRS